MQNTNPAESLLVFTKKLRSFLSCSVGWNLACFSESSQIYSNIIFKHTWTTWGLCLFKVKTLKSWHSSPTKATCIFFTRLLEQPSSSGLSLCPPISFSTSIYLPPIEISVIADEVYQVYQTKTVAPTSMAPNELKWKAFMCTPLLPFPIKVTTNLVGF